MLPLGYEWIREYLPRNCKSLNHVFPIYEGEYPHRYIEGETIYHRDNIMLINDNDTCYLVDYNKTMIKRERER